MQAFNKFFNQMITIVELTEKIIKACIALYLSH